MSGTRIPRILKRARTKTVARVLENVPILPSRRYVKVPRRREPVALSRADALIRDAEDKAATALAVSKAQHLAAYKPRSTIEPYVPTAKVPRVGLTMSVGAGASMPSLMAAPAQTQMTTPTTDALALEIWQAAKDLVEKGYAVVRGVLNSAQCAAGHDSLWTWAETVTQGRVQRDEPATWKHLPPSGHNVYKHFGIGHTSASWDTRTNPNVLRVFAELYGTDKLTTSFDGGSFTPPPEREVSARKRSPRHSWWPHTDQNLRAHGRRCIQGVVTFLPIEEGDASTYVLPGSHREHDLLNSTWKLPHAGASHWRRFSTAPGEGCSKSEMDLVYGADWKERFVRVLAPAGSLILWDSRTTHQNVCPAADRATPRGRSIVYVCMGPAKHLTPVEQRKKAKYAVDGRTTSHWPHKSNVNPITPQTYGAVLPPFTTPPSALAIADPVTRKLCSIDSYSPGNSGVLGWTAPRTPLLKFTPPADPFTKDVTANAAAAESGASAAASK